MRTFIIDIENSAHQVDAWGLFQQNIPLVQLREPGRMLCWAGKWFDDDEIFFESVRQPSEMLDELWMKLDEADAVVTYNGAKHDIPIINKEFVISDRLPPSPYKHIDHYKTVKKNFKFASGKLDFVTRQLGLGGKIGHSGYDLWLRVGDNEPDAWELMERYNVNDIIILEQLHRLLLPWTTGINHRLYGSVDGNSQEEHCPKCGGSPLVKQGFSYTLTGRYQRYRCSTSGCWSTASKRIDGTDIK
jgi:hypothetical protein